MSQKNNGIDANEMFFEFVKMIQERNGREEIKSHELLGLIEYFRIAAINQMTKKDKTK